MTQTPFIPLAPADLEHLASVVVPREWGGDRGVASLAGVDPKHIRVRVTEDGSIRGALVAHLTMAQSLGVTDRANSAIVALAEALEGLGYAVAWGPGPMVVGWAAVQAYPAAQCKCGHAQFEHRGLRQHGRCLVSGLARRTEAGKVTTDHCPCLRYRQDLAAVVGASSLVRIVDLDEIDPRVDAYRKALFAAREDRRAPEPAPDAKHVGAVARNEAAYPRGGR